jgi:hypothetical protein
MNARIQQQRFHATGERPAPGAQRPGQLFVNLPDLMIGATGTDGTPLDLLPVRTFSPAAAYAPGAFVALAGGIYRALQATGPGAFTAAHWRTLTPGIGAAGAPPPNPLEGDFWLDGGDLKRWTGADWTRAISTFLPLTGGELTGPLEVDGTTTLQDLLNIHGDLYFPANDAWVYPHDSGTGLSIQMLLSIFHLGVETAPARFEVRARGGGLNAGLRLTASDGRRALLDLLGATDAVRLVGPSEKLWDFLTDGTLLLPVQTTNANGAVRKSYVDTKITADIAAAISGLGGPLTQGAGDARYLRLTGGALSNTLTIDNPTASASLLVVGSSGVFYLSDQIATTHRGLHFAPATWLGSTGTGGVAGSTIRLQSGGSTLEMSPVGNLELTGNNVEGAHLTLQHPNGKGAHIDIVHGANQLRIFHDMGRAAGNHAVWSFLNDGTLQLPIQTSLATGAVRKDYVDAQISAWTNALTASINQRLTTAQADALFLTPAEGDALFLTPGEGDARFDARYLAGTFLGAGVQTPGRAYDTWYQNTTGRMMAISISLTAGGTTQALVSGTPSGGVAVGYSSTSGDRLHASFLVPPAHYYGVFGGTSPAINAWAEVRI